MSAAPDPGADGGHGQRPARDQAVLQPLDCEPQLAVEGLGGSAGEVGESVPQAGGGAHGVFLDEIILREK